MCHQDHRCWNNVLNHHQNHRVDQMKRSDWPTFNAHMRDNESGIREEDVVGSSKKDSGKYGNHRQGPYQQQYGGNSFGLRI